MLTTRNSNILWMCAIAWMSPSIKFTKCYIHFLSSAHKIINPNWSKSRFEFWYWNNYWIAIKEWIIAVSYLNHLNFWSNKFKLFEATNLFDNELLFESGEFHIGYFILKQRNSIYVYIYIASKTVSVRCDQYRIIKIASTCLLNIRKWICFPFSDIQHTWNIANIFQNGQSNVSNNLLK